MRDHLGLGGLELSQMSDQDRARVRVLDAELAKHFLAGIDCQHLSEGELEKKLKSAERTANRAVLQRLDQCLLDNLGFGVVLSALHP